MHDFWSQSHATLPQMPSTCAHGQPYCTDIINDARVHYYVYAKASMRSDYSRVLCPVNCAVLSRKIVLAEEQRVPVLNSRSTEAGHSNLYRQGRPHADGSSPQSSIMYFHWAHVRKTRQVGQNHHVLY